MACQKEMRWKQRSGCTWLKLGTRTPNISMQWQTEGQNTKFSGNNSGRQRNNCSQHNLQQYIGYIHSHFKNLLGQSNMQNTPFNLCGGVSSAFTQELQHLDDPITQIEIQLTINQCRTESPMDRTDFQLSSTKNYGQL